MRKHKLRLLCLMLAAVLLLPLSASAAVDESQTYFPVESNTWEGWPEGPDIAAYTGCVMDADTGQILYAKGMDAERYPASITKIMTAILIMDNCDMSSLVTMNEVGMADAYAGSSNITPTHGEIFTVEECLKMILVKSANDVSTQMAAFVAGSVEAFADIMNARAAALGCTHTHFANASGLHNPDHYTSAHDMALIMQEALKYQKFREIVSQQQVVIPETNFSGARYYDTHLEMLKEGRFYYEGTIGGKTGNTDEAMSTLVMAATRNGRTLIGVIMGHGSGEGIIFDMHAILDYGFGNTFPAPAPETTPAPTEAPEEAAAATSVSSGQTETSSEPVSETAVSSSAEAVAGSTETSENTPEEPARPSGSRRKAFLAVIIILVIIIVLLITAGAVSAARERKRRERRRRRREAARRAAEEAAGNQKRNGSRPTSKKRKTGGRTK